MRPILLLCDTCQVTGCRRRLKKRLPISVSSVVVERQPCRQHAAAANDVIDRSRAVSLSDEIITRFRRPMTPGDTRQNIAFEAVLEEHETDDSTIIEHFWLLIIVSINGCKKLILIINQQKRNIPWQNRKHILHFSDTYCHWLFVGCKCDCD